MLTCLPRTARRAVLGFLVLMCVLAAPGALMGQETGDVPSVSEAEWTNFAKAHIKIAGISTELQAELALLENKSEDAQTRVRKSARQKIQQVLKELGLSEARYSQLDFLIGTNDKQRDAFTKLLKELSAQKDATVSPKASPAP